MIRRGHDPLRRCFGLWRWRVLVEAKYKRKPHISWNGARREL
jgi:hypothetical protein